MQVTVGNSRIMSYQLKYLCYRQAWKARIAGYAEAKKLFELQDDPKSPEFSRYLGLIKKFVTDSNAIAQEKALDTVIAFLENAGAAGK